MKQNGGSGRGNKGVTVVHHDRPPCPECGGFMTSKGIRWKCTDCEYNPRKSSIENTVKQKSINKFEASYGFDLALAEQHARECEKYDRLIVTSAQNNSQVFDLMWSSLKQASAFYKCPIAVMPSHYRNDTTWSEGDEKEFPVKILPYLIHTDLIFGNYIIRPDARIRPTTLNPLSGKMAHGGHQNVVFSHPQVAREPVPTLGDGMPKLLFTTGSVTLPNYTTSDIGYKAEFHHCACALILEKHEGAVYVRQLASDDKGHIHDLDVRFTPNGFTGGHRAKVLTTGDEHVKFNAVEKETYGKNGLLDLLKPEYIVRHDILDGYAGSHHHEKNPMIQFIKHHKGDNDYRAEVEQAIDFINRTTPKYATTLIVPSNHHDHLTQFLNRADANKDHVNALFILEMQAKMREAALKGENYDPFYLYAKDKMKVKAKWLDRNTPHLIDGIEQGQHGDVGANGSRGSARGMAKTPDRMTIGHSHSARICQGVYQAGTSAGRMEYERGLSDHSISHVVQYKGGKRAILDFINGRFYAPRPRLSWQTLKCSKARKAI